MRRVLLLLFLLWLPTAEAVRVATYNVRNYNLSDRVIDGEWRPSYPKPESEKRALREVLREMDADIVALQEIGGDVFVHELQRDLELEGLVYPYVVSGPVGDPARQLAVLSKIPFVEVTEHDKLTFNYFGRRSEVLRGLLEVVFETEGGPWHLFVVHLKSQSTEREEDPRSAVYREGEARVIRDFLARRWDEGEGRYLVVGDFNDSTRSATLARFLRRGNRVLSTMVEAEDSRGHRWTHFYAREDIYSRIDYILISPALLEDLGTPRGRIWDSPAVPLASDHRPVVVDLDFGPAAEGAEAEIP